MRSYRNASRRRIASFAGAALLVTTLTAGSATALAPTLGVRKPVSSPVYGVAGEQQRFPAIASNVQTVRIEGVGVSAL